MICHFGQRDAGVTDSLDIRALRLLYSRVAGLHPVHFHAASANGTIFALLLAGTMFQ